MTITCQDTKTWCSWWWWCNVCSVPLRLSTLESFTVRTQFKVQVISNGPFWTDATAFTRLFFFHYKHFQLLVSSLCECFGVCSSFRSLDVTCLLVSSQIFGGLTWCLVASTLVIPANPLGWVMFVSIFCFVFTTLWFLIFLCGGNQSSVWPGLVIAHTHTDVMTVNDTCNGTGLVM